MEESETSLGVAKRRASRNGSRGGEDALLTPWAKMVAASRMKSQQMYEAAAAHRKARAITARAASLLFQKALARAVKSRKIFKYAAAAW